MFSAARHHLEILRILRGWGAETVALEAVSGPDRVILYNSDTWRTAAADERDRNNDSRQRDRANCCRNQAAPLTNRGRRSRHYLQETRAVLSTRRLLLSRFGPVGFPVAGDLLTGGAGLPTGAGGGGVERGQSVVGGQHGVPVPRGAVLANLLLLLLNLLPVLRRGPFGFLAVLAVSVPLRGGRSSLPGGRGEGCISVMVLSSTVNNRRRSESKRLGLSSRACRRTRPAMLAGRSLARGIRAAPTKTGMTRTLRVRAASISTRTKSSELSRHRRPSSPVIVSHRSPISASSTSQDPTATVITSTKLSPGSIESTSLKT